MASVSYSPHCLASRYLYEIFRMADCYDWSFVFSLILKSQTMITQVINSIRVQDLPHQMFALQRGLFELETWADNEWFVIFFLL